MRYEIYNHLKFYMFSRLIIYIYWQLKLHRKVHFHENILKFYGITKTETSKYIKKIVFIKITYFLFDITFFFSDMIHQMNNYTLVLEYADGGTLKTYLDEHFNELE